MPLILRPIPIPNFKLHMFRAYAIIILCSIISIFYSRWDILAFLVFWQLLLIGAYIRVYSHCNHKVVFDEIGIKMLSGEKIKKQYSWNELECVYYKNEFLSQKERKKLKRSRVPTGPKIAVNKKNARTFGKNIIQVFLLEHKEDTVYVLFPNQYIVSKEEVLGKLKDWNIALDVRDS